MIKGYARLTGKFPSGGIDKCKILKNPPVKGDWCAIYDDSVVMIDVDSYDHEGNKELQEPINGKPKHEAILEYLDEYDYKYNLISNPYTGNVHIIMKKPKDFEIDGNKNNWYCALGIRIEVKVTKIWENMKVNEVKRDFVKGSFESELDELAPGLFPIQKSMTSKKCDFSVINMSEGDGRNNAFSTLAFKLGAILGADHTKEVLTAMNSYVLKSPIDEKEMEVILRDETLEKINRKPSGKRMNYKQFHEYFSNQGVTIKYNEISNKIDYFNLPTDEYKLL
jgi:putative DNA primase/helicase